MQKFLKISEVRNPRNLSHLYALIEVTKSGAFDTEYIILYDNCI